MRTLVVGLGKSGLAACELLTCGGDRVLATDRQPTPEALARLDELGVEFVDRIVDAALTVISPGVPPDLPELAGHNLIGELELAFPHLRGPILGITGSNGKTTTTALCGHILNQAGIVNQVGGNIGIPPAAMIATSHDPQWNVLELSSFQLETTVTFHPRIGVCLNVTPNHLDRHHTFDNYAAAKSQMFLRQTPDEHKILNAQDDTCRRYAELGQAAVHWFNEAPSSGFETKLPGAHNQENIAAAVRACLLAGAPLEVIREAVASFPGVEHRLEFVAEIDGVRYINDSKATSVDATLKAIAALPGPLWLILGGKDKGSDYRPLIAPLTGRLRAGLVIGSAAPKILGQLGSELPVIGVETLEAAVQEAARRAEPGDTVLLAPACASFDQFRSFEHRGETFKTLVAEFRRDA